MSGGYDDGYRSCSCFWGTQPGSLLPMLLKHLGDPRGRAVLDAGCGEGKNATFLAAQGAVVRALDMSAIALLHAAAHWPHLPVQWEVADIREAQLPIAEYDAVIAYGLFHCLRSPEEVRVVAGHLLTATRPGGFAVVCAFNDRRQQLHAHPGFSPVLLPHAAYLSLYGGCKLLYATDEDLHETHPHNQIPHTHSMTRILAQKEK